MSRSTTFVPNAYFVDLTKPQKTEIRTLTQVATNSFFFSGLETTLLEALANWGEQRADCSGRYTLAVAKLSCVFFLFFFSTMFINISLN